MRLILGHKSRNLAEIVDILLTKGTYTCPTLPHYRYMGTKNACKRLQKYSLMKVVGKSETGINFVPTERLKLWHDAYMGGYTTLGPVKWAKLFRISLSRRDNANSHRSRS